MLLIFVFCLVLQSKNADSISSFGPLHSFIGTWYGAVGMYTNTTGSYCFAERVSISPMFPTHNEVAGDSIYSLQYVTVSVPYYRGVPYRRPNVIGQLQWIPTPTGGGSVVKVTQTTTQHWTHTAMGVGSAKNQSTSGGTILSVKTNATSGDPSYGIVSIEDSDAVGGGDGRWVSLLSNLYVQENLFWYNDTITVGGDVQHYVNCFVRDSLPQRSSIFAQSCSFLGSSVCPVPM
eukprot:PhF_6_TR28970/c0_g1_i1/m.42240